MPPGLQAAGGQGGHGDHRGMQAASTAVGVTRPALPEATRVRVWEGGPSRPCQAPPAGAAQGLWDSPHRAGLDLFPLLSDIFSSNLSTTRKPGSTSVSSGNPEHLLCSGHGGAHTTPSVLACGTSTRALQRTGEAQHPRWQCPCQQGDHISALFCGKAAEKWSRGQARAPQSSSAILDCITGLT